jgi:hypothetical protein
MKRPFGPKFAVTAKKVRMQGGMKLRAGAYWVVREDVTLR